ncbi:hypothetical protein F5X98DRAFT_168297 [Xylaria grammica]|nr:hypothetical protein F5X98DRAFT_168297 [Xylaria grammica]
MTSGRAVRFALVNLNDAAVPQAGQGLMIREVGFMQFLYSTCTYVGVCTYLGRCFLFNRREKTTQICRKGTMVIPLLHVLPGVIPMVYLPALDIHLWFALEGIAVSRQKGRMEIGNRLWV